MKDYQSVHRDLLGMLEDLDGKLEQIVDPEAASIKSDATEPVAAETDLSEVARAEVEKIKQTIASIQSGRSGVCLLCGQPIDAQRLARLPLAHYCARCTGNGH